MNSGVAILEPVGDGRDFFIRDINPAAETIDRNSKEETPGKSVRACTRQ